MNTEIDMTLPFGGAPKHESREDAQRQVEQLVVCYRCGWCGAPTDKEGRPLGMSEIGLKKDISLWDDAELVNGQCCENEVRAQEQYKHERMCDIYRDA